MAALRPRRAEAYAAGNIDEIVREHTPLVRRLAFQIGSRLPASIELDDLVQEGMLGLLDAARRWQPQAGGAPFGAYARLRVRGAIYDWLRGNDLMPRHQRDKLRAAQEAVTALEHSLGRPPEDAEVAAAMGISAADYRSLLDGAVSINIVDEMPESDEPESDARSDPLEQAALRETMQRLLPLLPLLPLKEQQVLALHYNEHLSYREIAFVMDLTGGRISQLHSQAMLRLRGWLQNPSTRPEAPPG
jgi:RNA polymerase sigma factor for flagellar operon FliA